MIMIRIYYIANNKKLKSKKLYPYHIFNVFNIFNITFLERNKMYRIIEKIRDFEKNTICEVKGLHNAKFILLALQTMTKRLDITYTIEEIS